MTPPVIKPPRNPRSLQIEAEYLTTDVRELAELKAQLVEYGVPNAAAAGIVGWLVDKAAGRPDATTQDTRARYRRYLSELPADAHNPRSPEACAA